MKLDSSDKEVHEVFEIKEGSDDDDGNMEIKKTHCRPNAVFDLIKDFSERQKSNVISVGFGGLLELKLTRVSTKMFHGHHFNENSCMFKINMVKEFYVSSYDVQDIFLLPNITENKLTYQLRKQPIANMVIQKEWKKKLGIPDSDDIFVNNLENKIKSLKEGGDGFKRFFVMYVCSTFLAPVTNRVIDYKIINYADNVKEKRNLDWCGYVLNNLCKALGSFKNNKHKESRTGISGCVLILQIVYFHHLSFRGQLEPTTLPLIKHWTDEKVRERIACKAKASFGQGEIQKYVYLVCRIGGQQAYLGDVIENAYRNFAERERRLVSFNLPEGVMTDSRIHDTAHGVSNFF